MGNRRLRLSPPRRRPAKFLKGLGEALVLRAELGFDHGGAVVGHIPESQAIPVDLPHPVAFHIGQSHSRLLQFLLERLNPDCEDVRRGVRVHLFPRP